MASVFDNIVFDNIVKAPVIKLSKGPDPESVDWINERAAKISGITLKFIYQGDPGQSPSSRAHAMNLEEFSKLQQEADHRDEIINTPCEGKCGHDVKRPLITKRLPTFTQVADMSEAWSRELRAKVKESDRIRKEKEKNKVVIDLQDDDF